MLLFSSLFYFIHGVYGKCAENRTLKMSMQISLAIQNGHPSGVCSNMLLSELNDANIETVEDTKLRVFKVKKHKTLRTHGFAKVYLKQHIFNNLKIFVKFVLPLQLPGEVNHVFKKFFGRHMSSGEVSTQLNSLWMQADVFENDKVPTKKIYINISCTLFRKLISLERQPEGSAALADLLVHNSSTQGKYFNVRRRNKSSARGALNISNLWKSCSSTSSPAKNVATKSLLIPDPTIFSRKQWEQIEIDEVWEIFDTLIKSAENFGLNDIIKVKSHFILLKNLDMKSL